MYTPVNPSLTILKWGLRGSKLYRHVFVMGSINATETKLTLCMLGNLHDFFFVVCGFF